MREAPLEDRRVAAVYGGALHGARNLWRRKQAFTVARHSSPQTSHVLRDHAAIDPKNAKCMCTGPASGVR